MLEVAVRDASVMQKIQDLYEGAWETHSPPPMDYSPGGTRLTPLTVSTTHDAVQSPSPPDYIEMIRDVNGSKRLEKILFEEQSPELMAKIEYASNRARCVEDEDDECDYVFNFRNCIKTLNQHYRTYDSGANINPDHAEEVWATLTAHISFIKNSVNRLSTLDRKEFALSTVCEIAEEMLGKNHGALCKLIRQRLGNGELQDQFIEDAVEHIVKSYTQDDMDNLVIEDSPGHQALGWLVDHSHELRLLNEPRLRACLGAFRCDL